MGKLLPTTRTLALIHGLEGLRLRAYWDRWGQVWTIGWGNTRYEDGSPVREGHVITKERADALALFWVHKFAQAVDDLTTDAINQAQLDALTSLVYNIGPEAYRTSRLRGMINTNPNDPAIRAEWVRWKFAGGEPVLLGRRQREVAHYFQEEAA